MQRISIISIAQQRVAAVLPAGAMAIDATVGNGHDTLFLAERLGNQGHLWGFDIQAQALANTRLRLQALPRPPHVELCLQSHARMAACVPAQWHGRVQAIMFNLGYLPGGDKSIITQVKSTLTALQAASELLAKGGVLTVAVYPGHDGGKQEAEQVERWLDKLPSRDFVIECVLSQFDRPTAPRLFVITKRFDLL